MSEAIQKQLLWDGVGEEKKWDIGHIGQAYKLEPGDLIDTLAITPRLEQQIIISLKAIRDIINSEIYGDREANYHIRMEGGLAGVTIQISRYDGEIPKTLEEAVEVIT